MFGRATEIRIQNNFTSVCDLYVDDIVEEDITAESYRTDVCDQK